MGFWDGLDDAVEDTVKSVAEANVIPLGIAGQILDANDAGDAVAGVGGYLRDTLFPIIPMGRAMGSVITGEPDVADAGGLPIIAAALATLKEMRQQCGDGEPDQGADFRTGANQFDMIADMLGSAKPPDTWQGAASDAYGRANEHQKHRAANVADADGKVTEALATEAQQVADTRFAIGAAVRFLNACIVAATAAGALGDAALYGFQIQSVEAAMPPAVASFRGLSTAAAQNAAKIQLASALYGAIGADSGGAPGGVGPQLSVVTDDVRRTSDDQHLIAGQIETAGTTTAGTPANVAKTHGTVCAAAVSALAAAADARAGAATAMHTRSLQLSAALRAAAQHYDAVDQQRRVEHEKEMRPR